jgi:predicted DNA binding CopG/RHH family protein
MQSTIGCYDRESGITRAHYDLSKMKARKNPYAKRLKREVTIRIGVDVIEYFKQMAKKCGIPCQNLINLYLTDCVQSGRKLQWAS